MATPIKPFFWFAKQSDDLQIEICKSSFELFHQKYRHEHERDEALWRSLQEAILQTHQALFGRAKETTLENAKIKDKLLSKLVSKKRVRNTTSKVERLDKLYHFEILKLRDEGKSWRLIAEYLDKAHKKKVSHVSLRAFYGNI